MKTSNKILLGVFLLCVLTIVGIHVALYAKIKVGDFASNDEIYSRTHHQQVLPSTIKAVSITGLANCNLHNGSPSLNYHKESNAQVKITISNDTLYLTANDWARKEDYEEGARNHQIVDLTVPANLPVSIQYGELYLMGSGDSTHAPSYNIDMRRHAHLKMIDWEFKKPVYFNRLQVVSDDSNMDLSSQAIINEMNVRAASSYLNYKRSVIKQHHLQIDDQTTIVATKKSLGDFSLPSKQ